MKLHTNVFLALLVFAFTAYSANAVHADIVAADSFPTDGALVGQIPSPGPGLAWASHSGAGNKPIMVTGGGVVLDQSTGSGEDVNTRFAAFGATDTIYARFDFSLASGLGAVNPDANGLYFAHFKDATFGFRGRTGVLSPAAAGDFVLGINADSSNLGAGAQWASDLSFDTVYRTVISYNAATGESRLWLDPTDVNSTNIGHTATAGTLIESFAFRQSNDFTGSQLIDNLVVATNFDQALSGVPEPGSVGLLVLGAIGLVSRRRRNA